MRIKNINPTDRDVEHTDAAVTVRKEVNDRTGELLRCDAAVWREDPRRQVLSTDRKQEKRPMQAARRPRRRALGGAERGVAARRKVQGGNSPAQGDSSAVARSTPVAGGGLDIGRSLEANLAEPSAPRTAALSQAERAEMVATRRRHQDHWDRVYEQLLLDAQACARAMQASPALDRPEAWREVASRSLDDYRSGRSLMGHLGAARLVDPATTGMLLAIRRALIEENNAASMLECLLIDMSVVAFASAMRLQSIVGNTALVLEGELFGQPTLRTKWEDAHGSPPEIRGLAVDEHVAKLQERIMPLIERFHRMGRESLDAVARARRMPDVSVERAGAITIVLAAP